MIVIVDNLHLADKIPKANCGCYLPILDSLQFTFSQRAKTVKTKAIEKLLTMGIELQITLLKALDSSATSGYISHCLWGLGVDEGAVNSALINNRVSIDESTSKTLNEMLD